MHTNGKVEAQKINRNLTKYHWKYLNPLTQVRESINVDELEPLILSIQRCHQLNPILAVRKSPNQAKEYLSWINDLWKLKGDDGHELSDQKPLPDSEDYAFILAGHRRWKVFSLDMLTKDEMEVFMYLDLSPFRAIKLQLAENTYKAPDTTRKYMAVDRYLRLHRKHGHDMNKTECARHLGIQPEIVTKATRFANLPRKIRQAVENDQIQISAGHGVLLERLAEGWRKKLRNKQKSEKEIQSQVRKRLIIRADKIIEKGLSVSDFEEQIAGVLDETERNQQTFFEPETPNPQPERVFDPETVHWMGQYRRTIKSRLEWLKHRLEAGETQEDNGRFVTNDLEYQAGEDLAFLKYHLENFERFLNILARLDGLERLPETDFGEVAEIARRVGKYDQNNENPQG